MHKGIVFGLAVSVFFIGSADAADGAIVRKVSGENGFLTPEQLCTAKKYQDFFSKNTSHNSTQFVWKLVLGSRNHRLEGSLDDYRRYKECFQHERREFLGALRSSRHKLTRTDVILLELYTTHIFMWGFMCALMDGYDALTWPMKKEREFSNFDYYCELAWNTLEENQKQDTDFVCRLREKEKEELGLDRPAERDRWLAEIVPSYKLVGYEYIVIGKRGPKKTSCITIEYALAE